MLIALSGMLATAVAGPFVTISREAMATTIQVVLPEADADAAELAFASFDEVEASANEWRPDSTLGKLNATGHAALDADLCELLKRGLELGEATHGAFDVTWAALWGVWDFRAERPAVPDPALIRERVASVGYSRLSLSAGCEASLPPGVVVGLGGIAKGFALDRAAAALRASGVTAFSISAGGQIVVGGLRDGRPWRVGVRDPRGDRDDAFALVEATDVSVSTSGDYERFFVVDGTRYHHILDPRTGWPSRGLRAATVVCADATLADGLSTAVMVLGRDAGLRVVAEQGCEGLVVADDGSVAATPDLGAGLVVLHPPRSGPQDVAGGPSVRRSPD